MSIERKFRVALDSFLGRLIDILGRGRSKLVPAGTEPVEDDTDDFEPLTPEQLAVIARAEPLERGRVIESLLPDEQTLEAAQSVGHMSHEEISTAVSDIESSDEAALKAEAARREARLGSIFFGSIVLLMLVAFVIAMLAILFMK